MISIRVEHNYSKKILCRLKSINLIILFFCIVSFLTPIIVFAGGVCFITHGWQGDMAWVEDAGDKLISRNGGSSIVSEYRIILSSTGFSIINPNGVQFGSNANTTGYAVVKLDWTEFAGEVITYPDLIATVDTGSIAEDLVAILLNYSDTTRKLLASPIHLIGHSRGGSLVGAMAKELGNYGYWVDQVTFLDPHPVENTVFTDDWGEEEMSVPGNVIFADNYYREGGIIHPNGEYVNSAYNIQLKNNYFDDTWYQWDTELGYESEHSDVHAWYRGTIPSSTPPYGIDDFQITSDWYVADAYDDGVARPRDTIGYAFSLTANGGANRPCEGIHSGINGNGMIRSFNPPIPTMVDNVGYLTLRSTNVTAGSTFEADYRYESWSSDFGVAFYLDNNRNPHDGYDSLLGVHSHGVSGGMAGANAPASLTIPPNQTADTYYVLIKATGSSAARYFYAPMRLTVAEVSEPIPPEDEIVTLTASDDTYVVSSYPTLPLGNEFVFSVVEGDADYYGLVKFNLNNIPDGSEIHDVELELYCTYALGSEIYIIESDYSWSESTTWDTKPPPFEGEYHFRESISGIGYQTIEDPELINLVEAWATGSQSNYGIYLFGGKVGDSFSFGSSEDSNSSQRPKLIVTYTPPALPSKATNPSPNNTATDRSISTDLSWSNGGGATSYDVYFGTDPTPDSGEFKGNQTSTSYDPGTLNRDTTYYWRIDAKNPAGTTTGDVWSFSTVALSYIEISGPTQVSEETYSPYFCIAYYDDGSTADVTFSTSWNENSLHAYINSSGYLTTTWVPSDQSCQITASYRGETDIHDITIKSIWGKIAGTVTGDSDGQPIAGLWVSANDSSSGLYRSAQTQSDGTYTITGLPTGNYQLYVDAMGTDYVSEHYNDVENYNSATSVAVTIGQTTSGIDFSLTVGGKITGVVVADSDSQPITGVSIYAENSFNGPDGWHGGSAQTQSDGSYTISGLPADSYFVRIGYGNDYYVREFYDNAYCSSLGSKVSVALGHTVSDINFQLDADSDNDSMGDDWEIANNLNPNDPSDGQIDIDNDGLANAAEFSSCTDPYNNDTDGDLFNDDYEIYQSQTDPIDNADAPDLKVDGVIWQANTPTGLKTYIDVLIYNHLSGQSGFFGTVPDDLSNITVTGPNGLLPYDKNSFEYSEPLPIFTECLLIIDNPPELGEYTFTVTTPYSNGTATDYQSENKIIPIPDINTFSPVDGAVLSSKTPAFSFEAIDYNEADVYYRIKITDSQDNHVFLSTRRKGITSIAIPEGTLTPGQTYKWRAECFESSEFLKVQNRSESEWLTFSMDSTLSHSSKPAINIGPAWGITTYNTTNGMFLVFDVGIIDQDGVADNGSSHQATVTFPDGTTTYTLNLYKLMSSTLAYYNYGIPITGNPQAGEYTFTVTDLDGNMFSIVDTLTINALTPPDEDSFTPSMKNESVIVYFDNVYVNGSLYEDFNSYTSMNDCVPSKWFYYSGQTSIENQQLKMVAENCVGLCDAVLLTDSSEMYVTPYPYATPGTYDLGNIVENGITYNKVVTATVDTITTTKTIVDGTTTIDDGVYVTETTTTTPGICAGPNETQVAVDIDLSVGGDYSNAETCAATVTSTVETNPPVVTTSLSADVTLTSASSEQPYGSIGGFLYNNGRDDVFVELQLSNNAVRYRVREQIIDSGDLSSVILASGELMIGSFMGQTVNLSIAWDGTTITFDANGTMASYTPAGIVKPTINNGIGLAASLVPFVDASPVLTWDPVTDADWYRVQIYSYDNSQSIWSGFAYNQTTYRVPPGILKPFTKYRYRVEAWDYLHPYNVDNVSLTPFLSDQRYIFYTTEEEAVDPYIELYGHGVYTLNNSDGAKLAYMVKVHDAQGVPGNIQYVKVALPGGGEEFLTYDLGNPDNTATGGIYKLESALPITDGTYTFTVGDNDTHTYSTTEDLVSNTIGYPALSSLTSLNNGTTIELDWDDVEDANTYRIEIYDSDNNREYLFITDQNNYSLPVGLFEQGSICRYKIITRRESITAGSYDNISISPADLSDMPCIINPVMPGDINSDCEITLADAILALKVIAGLNPEGVNINADVNGDGKIGLQDVLYIMQKIAGIR